MTPHLPLHLGTSYRQRREAISRFDAPEEPEELHLDHLPGSFFGPSTLVHLLRHRSLHQRHDRAYIYLVDGEADEQIITYEELDRQARAIGAYLQSLGLEGERALLLYPAGLEFISAFFGCLYAGIVAVPAYPPRRNRKMARVKSIVENAQAKIALTTASSLDRIQDLVSASPELSNLLWKATDEIPEQIEHNWHPPEVHGDTLAVIQYTSGSTGAPKGVMLSHANLMHNSAMISYAFEHTRSGMGMFWLPSYHDMGLIGGVLQPLYIGQPNVLMSPMAFMQKPYRWLNAISHYRCTISGGPNFAYDLCVKKVTPEQRATLDLSSWHLAFNGAEPVRAETLDQFVDTFGPCGFKREAFYPCYGLAEATLIVSGGFKTALPVINSFDSAGLQQGRVTTLSDDLGARELVGSGGNLLDQKIVIVDPETKSQLPVDKIGEIWVSGPSLAQGYWRRKEDTERTFQAYLSDSGEGPFLRTGDLGFMRDGEVFVTGRLKDLIIVRGVNHYPQDLEWTAEKSHPRLRPGSGAAFTVDSEGCDHLIIVHEIERRQRGDFEKIIASVRRAIAKEHEVAPDVIVLLQAGSIPKTSSGKIQRHACRDSFVENKLSEVARWSALDTSGDLETPPKKTAQLAKPHVASVAGNVIQQEDATTRVMNAVHKVAGDRAKNLTLGSSIAELGLDSLERMEIVALLEDQYGARFPEAILPDMETCQEVIEAVQCHLLGTNGTPPQAEKSYEITPELYDFAKFPEYLQLQQMRKKFTEQGIDNPFFEIHEGITNDRTVIGDQEFINFASYNYLGMSGDPVVAQGAKAAIDRYGTSASASRLVSGEKRIHSELEHEIAQFLGVQAVLVHIGGHATNESTLGHLLNPGDLILHDALAHNSILQGAKLSGARRRPFPHNDFQALDHILAEQRNQYRRVLIAIEGVYSMDGDIPDLRRFVEVKKKHHALLYVDEAHSLGTLGATGRGLSEHAGIDAKEVDVWMGTLSKSLGASGGYIAGCQALVEYLKYTSPGFVFSVALAPAEAGAAKSSLQLMQREPERVTQLASNANLFLRLAREAGLNTGLSKDTPVIPVILGNSRLALELSLALKAQGINVQPILYPAVEESSARLRFFITATHTEKQIRYTVEAVSNELGKITCQCALGEASTNGLPRRQTSRRQSAHK